MKNGQAFRGVMKEYDYKKKVGSSVWRKRTPTGGTPSSIRNMEGHMFDLPSLILDAFQFFFKSVYVSKPASSASHTPSSVNGFEMVVTEILESDIF